MEKGVEGFVESHVAEARKFPDPAAEVVEVVPHHLRSEHAVRSGSSLEGVRKPPFERAWLFRAPGVSRGEPIRDVGECRLLEVYLFLNR